MVLRKRLVGELTIIFPDGYEEKCTVRERSRRNFENRLIESLKTILESGQTQGKVKIKYRGAFAVGIYDMLKTKTKDITVIT